MYVVVYESQAYGPFASHAEAIAWVDVTFNPRDNYLIMALLTP